MAKIVTYIVLVVGIMVLFNMSGLQTAGSIIIEQLGITDSNIQNFRVTSFFTTFLVAAIAALTTTGIVMGIFGRGSPEIFVTALYATPLVALIGEMITIAVYASGNWVGSVLILIMSPLIVAYVVALYDWVRGKD